MKQIIIFIMLFFIPGNIPEGINNIKYIQKPNKKLAKAIYKRVKYTKSFMIAYISRESVAYYNHKNNIDTLYDIASISKTFTAITIIVLHAEGKLDIDDYASDYINYYDKGVTIRHLITHSAFKPYGVKASYSNMNYISLKEIIEKISGVSYADNVRMKILDPLQMNSTIVKYSNGAGSIISSTRDLVKYCQMLLDKGQPIMDEYDYLLLTEPTCESTPDNYYWNTGGFETFEKDNKITSIYKSGRWYYSVSGIEIFPEKGKALIYVGAPKGCLSRWVMRWRNRTWRFLRRKI